jgi:AcrR family transcriptional regulator
MNRKSNPVKTQVRQAASTKVRQAASAQARATELRSTAEPRTTTSAPTLARALRDVAKKRVTPPDAYELARKKWLAGERLDIGALAAELGVGRATLFRWVGSRELLYGEILSTEYERERARGRRKLPGVGADLMAESTRRTLGGLLNAAPLRRFIEQDPEFALRVLTSKSSPVQARCIKLELDLLRELQDKGEIRPMLDLETLAYIIVRIGESFLYGDVISGREPDIEKAAAAVRILVAAEAPAAAPRARPKTPRGRSRVRARD